MYVLQESPHTFFPSRSALNPKVIIEEAKLKHAWGDETFLSKECSNVGRPESTHRYKLSVTETVTLISSFLVTRDGAPNSHIWIQLTDRGRQSRTSLPRT